jgi:hypothetical protein
MAWRENDPKPTATVTSTCDPPYRCGNASSAARASSLVKDECMKPLTLLSILTLLPSIALAQQTMKTDCSAYHKNSDGLWTVVRENVIILDGKPISVKLTMACCFGSESKRLILDHVNIINIIERSCF